MSTHLLLYSSNWWRQNLTTVLGSWLFSPIIKVSACRPGDLGSNPTRDFQNPKWGYTLLRVLLVRCIHAHGDHISSAQLHSAPLYSIRLNCTPLNSSLLISAMRTVMQRPKFEVIKLSTVSVCVFLWIFCFCFRELLKTMICCIYVFT